jgi:hypothetical protein
MQKKRFEVKGKGSKNIFDNSNIASLTPEFCERLTMS